jgi:hypothetical protein
VKLHRPFSDCVIWPIAVLRSVHRSVHLEQCRPIGCTTQRSRVTDLGSPTMLCNVPSSQRLAKSSSHPACDSQHPNTAMTAHTPASPGLSVPDSTANSGSLIAVAYAVRPHCLTSSSPLSNAPTQPRPTRSHRLLANALSASASTGLPSSPNARVARSQTICSRWSCVTVGWQPTGSGRRRLIDLTEVEWWLEGHSSGDQR